MALTVPEDPRLWLEVGSKCAIYSRSKQQWIPGKITKVYIDDNTNKEWLVVKYGKKTKQIQRFCNDLQAMVDDDINDIVADSKEDELTDPRISLDISSLCQIYSRSKQEWFDGVIHKIFIDQNTNKEWLMVKYGNNKTKKIQRLCQDLRIKKMEQTKDMKEEIDDDLIYKIRSLNEAAMQQDVNNNNNDFQYLGDANLLKKFNGQWTQLKSVTFSTMNSYSTMIAIANNDFMIATKYGIYRYNIIKDEWYNMSYPVNMPQIGYWSTNIMVCDQCRNELYMVTSDSFNPELIKLSIEKHKNDKIESWDKISGVGTCPFYVDNSECHFLEQTYGEQAAIYTTWDFKTNDIDTMIAEYPKEAQIESVSDRIYLKLQKKLLVFMMRHIYSFDLKTKKWDKIQVEIPFNALEFGNEKICISSDERYIVFIGSNLILLDLEKVEIYGGGKIRLPYSKALKYDCIIMECGTNQQKTIVTFEWIKKIVFHGIDIGIPMDLIHLIAMYWNNDYLYLLDTNVNTPNLWRISMDAILQSDMYQLDDMLMHY